jgi:hypothetical protein
MRLTSQHEREILAALKTNDWTGRWEGDHAACPVTIWMEGTRGSLRIQFTVRRGLRIYSGDDTQVRTVLRRIDGICRLEHHEIREPFEEVPAPPIESHHHHARPHRNGHRPTLLGYGVCQVLQWMGAHGYNSFDATNALRHFGLSDSFSKKTISRAMDKGRHPDRDGIKPVSLPETVVEQLELFRDLARRAG